MSDGDRDGDCDGDSPFNTTQLPSNNSLMGWRYFWGQIRGPLVSITQNINKTRYVRLLRGYLFPVIHQLEMISLGIQLENILFQQDNAPVHKAYSVIDWFQGNFIEVEENPHILLI